MPIVTLEVASLADSLKSFGHDWKVRKAKAPRIAFESPTLLLRVLGGRRWDLLQSLTGAGAVTTREAARLAGRDVKAVHSDLQVLLRAGLLRREESRRVIFPYNGVHVEFTLRAA